MPRWWPFIAKPERAVARRPPEAEFLPDMARLFRTYPAHGISPAKLRWLLEDADIGYTGPIMELLDDVAADAHVASVLRTRKLAVAGASYSVVSADDSDRAKQIADEAQAFIDAIPNWRQLCCDLLDASYRGFAACLPIWEGRQGKWWIRGHQAIESRFFVFEDYGELPLLLSNTAPEGDPLPEGILWHEFRDKPGPVVRGGLGRSIAKLWLYKSLNLVDCASFLERFGHPHVQVELPPHIRTGSAEYEQARKAAKSIIADQVGLVPAGVTLTILDAINKAGNLDGVYLAFLRWCDEGISKAVLGGTLTTDAGPTGLGHGREAKEHGKIRQDIVEFDAYELEDTLDSQLLRAWTAYHYGPEAPQPYGEFDVCEPENEVDKRTAQKLRAETISILVAAGLSVSKAQMREEFELVEVEGEEDALEKAAPPPAPIPFPAQGGQGGGQEQPGGGA
jgi:phage gp29-like protein